MHKVNFKFLQSLGHHKTVGARGYMCRPLSNMYPTLCQQLVKGFNMSKQNQVDKEMVLPLWRELD